MKYWKDSKCNKDWRNRHDWKSKGVVGVRRIYEVFTCIHCEQSIKVELDMLSKVKPAKEEHF